ncbi:hypothetical protein [Kitasatospora nipponensis]
MAPTELDARFAQLRSQLSAGLQAPPTTAVVRSAVRRRRRRRALGAAGAGALALALFAAAPHLLVPGGYSQVGQPDQTGEVRLGWPDSTPSLPVSQATHEWDSGALPLETAQLPVLQQAYGPWLPVLREDGHPAAPALDTDQPACLAGPVAALNAVSVGGQDYVEDGGRSDGSRQAGPAQAYQLVLSFADASAAARAGRVLAGSYGCKGGHGSLAKVASDGELTVLRDDYLDPSDQPVTSVEEFTVEVRGVRVGVLGVRRVYRPGEPGFGRVPALDSHFAAAAAELADRLQTG